MGLLKLPRFFYWILCFIPSLFRPEGSNSFINIPSCLEWFLLLVLHLPVTSALGGGVSVGSGSAMLQ